MFSENTLPGRNSCIVDGKEDLAADRFQGIKAILAE
jgi:hypothetical protein